MILSLVPKRKSGEHPTAQEKTWKALAVDIKVEIQIRNQLAHSPVAPNVEFGKRNSDGLPMSITDVWFASYMSGTEKLREKSGKKDLRLDDVKAHLKQVSDIINRLRNFRERELSKLLK